MISARGRGSPACISGSDCGCFSRLQRSPSMVVAGSIAVLFATAYLLAAPMGRDLSAQLAHAQLAEQAWPAVLNLRWYGGFDPLGYSVLSPAGDGAAGRTPYDGACLPCERRAFRGVVEGTAVPRPAAGAIVAAVCLTGNLVTTRTTFALGLAVGLGALVALVSGRLRVTPVLAVIAALFSPVAGLFLGVAGGALFLSGKRRGGMTLGHQRLGADCRCRAGVWQRRVPNVRSLSMR